MAGRKITRIILLISGDLVLATAAFLLAYCVRNYFSVAFQLTLSHEINFYIVYWMISLLFLLLVFSIYYLYDRNRSPISLSYLSDHVKAVFIWGVILISLPFFSKTDYSRGIVLMYFLFSIPLFLLLRVVVAYIVSVNLEHEWLIYRFIKRIMDIILSLFLITILFPFLLILMFLIRRDSPGPAIFKQDRVGLGGKIFQMYKFRTMRYGVESYALAPVDENDPRLTSSGKILRRFGLDELPQFINVLKGDMSLVGPRPEMPFVVSKYTNGQRRRLEALPGITGLWQILGRRDVPLTENLEYDFYYLAHRSILLDMVILIKTIPVVLFGKGTY